MRFPHLLVAAALLLSGCSSPADRAMRASPDFKAGYNDGCGSAGNQGANERHDSMARDDEAYRTNKAYRAGWSTGFNACRLSQPGSNMPGAPDQGLLRDPSPGSQP